MRELDIKIVSPNYKVRRETKKIEYVMNNAELNCARNGHDAIQVIIQPKRDIKNYFLSILDNEGIDVSDSLFKIYIEKYAEVDRPTRNNRYIHPLGYYPDALVPINICKEFNELSIQKGHNQAIYISFLAENFNVGKYEYSISLLVDDEEYIIPLTVNVYDCEVPEKVNLQTLFITRKYYIANGEGYINQDLSMAYQNALLEYRLNPYTFPVETLDVNEFADYVEEYHYNPRLVKYGFPSQLGGGGGVFDLDLLQRQILELAKRSKKDYNLLVKAFIKNGDEPEDNNSMQQLINTEYELKEFLIQTALIIKEDETGIYDSFKENENWYDSIVEMDVIVPFSKPFTLMAPVWDETMIQTEMLKAVNTWCPKPYSFDFDRVALTNSVRKKYQPNRNMWWYVCNDPVWPYPSYHIDDVLIGARLMSYMQYQHDIIGNLYWSPVCFADKARPCGVTKYTQPYRSGGVGCPSGEGFLFYPGAPYNHFGPLPSLRLMSIRDGMEDYELLLQYDNKITTFCKEHNIEDYDSKSVLNTYLDQIICGAQFYENIDTFDQIRKTLMIDVSNFDKKHYKIVKVEHGLDFGKVVIYADKTIVVNGVEYSNSTGVWEKIVINLKYNKQKNYLSIVCDNEKYMYFVATKHKVLTKFNKIVKPEHFDLSENGQVYMDSRHLTIECPLVTSPHRDFQVITGAMIKTTYFNCDKVDLSKSRYLRVEIENPSDETYAFKFILYAKDGYYVDLETYLPKNERNSYYIRTDRIEWSKLNRVTGIGFTLSGKKTQEKFTLKLVSLTVIS